MALGFPVWTANCDLSSFSIVITGWVGITVVGFQMATYFLIFVGDSAYTDSVCPQARGYFSGDLCPQKKYRIAHLISQQQKLKDTQSV